MRLIRDGVVDREGVEGLARRLGYSTRQLNRLITAEVGTGPLALARAQRSQTARVLLETTELPVAHVAFAAGFSSVRQCNDTVRQTFADTPSGLRARAARTAQGKRARPGPGHAGHPAATALPATLQSGVGARLPGTARAARRRGARRYVVHAQLSPPARARHRDVDRARGRGRRRRRRTGLCGGRADPRGPARPAHRRGALSPAARPRRRPGRHLGGPGRRPADRRPGAARSRAPRPRRRRRLRARGARRHRAAGLGPRGAHASPGDWSWRRANPSPHPSAR